MNKLKYNKSKDIYQYGGEFKTREDYISAVGKFLNRYNGSNLSNKTEWDAEIEKEFVDFLKSDKAASLGIKTGKDFREKVLKAQAPKTRLEKYKEADKKRAKSVTRDWSKPITETIKNEKETKPTISKDSSIITEAGDIIGAIKDSATGFYDKYVGGDDDSDDSQDTGKQIFADVEVPVTKKELDSKYQLLHDTVLTYDPYVRSGANFYRKNTNPEYVPTYKAIGTSYERDLRGYNAGDQTQKDKKLGSIVTSSDLPELEKQGYKYTGKPNYPEVTGSVIPLLDHSLASGYKHPYYDAWFNSLKDDDIVQVASTSKDGNISLQYKNKKDVQKGETAVKGRTKTLSELESSVTKEGDNEFFNFQSSKGVYSKTPFVSNDFPIPAGPRTQNLKLPFSELSGAGRFKGAMVGIYTKDENGQITDYGQMSGGVADIMKRAREIKAKTGQEPNIVLYDAGSVSGSIASPDGWNEEHYNKLTGYNNSVFATPTLLATKTPTRRVILKDLLNNKNDTLFFNTLAPKTEKEQELFRKKIIRQRGGTLSNLPRYKYGGKLEEDWIREYTIDGKKAKFFGNTEGNSSVKFNRVAMIASRYDEIVKKLDEIISEESKKTQYNSQTGNTETTQIYNLAVAFKLIVQTGIRIGNEDSAEGFMSTYKEKGKEVLAKTYGLSTLLPEHIEFKNGVAYLDFTGKKHVENKFTLSKELSKLVKPIYDSKFPTLFNIDEYTLTQFIKSTTSPYFSSKDFRTFRANVYANEIARTIAKPKIKKEYRDAVNKVADYVSSKLNNTPAVVKKSYIDGLLFWYYFGKNEDLPSKLDDTKSKKLQKGGSVVIQYKYDKGGRIDMFDYLFDNTQTKFQEGGTTSFVDSAANGLNYMLSLVGLDLKNKDGSTYDFNQSTRTIDSLSRKVDTHRAEVARIEEEQRKLREEYDKKLKQYNDFVKSSKYYNPSDTLSAGYKSGGTIPERYKKLGFTKVGQEKESTRKGKKWMVLAKKGDKYKVVHGGDPNMEDYSQHKDPKRRKEFWDRMGGRSSAKAKDPFSALYWAKKLGTW